MQQLELFGRVTDAFSIDPCRTHQPGHRLPVLGYNHFLAPSHPIEEGRKVPLRLEGSHRNDYTNLIWDTSWMI